VRILGRGTKRGERDYPKVLAGTLNGKFPRNSLGRAAGIPYDRPSLHVQGFCNPMRETRDAAVTEFLDTLRRLADQWIASGKDQLGELPWSRNIRWFSDEYQESIDRILRKFLHRHPPPIEPDSNGRLETASHLWLPTPLAWPFPEPELEDTLAQARDFATLEFQKFLDSSCPQRFFKCDGCGTYFVRARAPRKETPIYHGTFCENCKHKGGKRRTDSTRKQRKALMIEWAADNWPKWTKRSGVRSEWVAEQVNKRVERQPISWDTIKGNWVTWHQAEIEAEVERRNYAKG